jgi:hypothetical protein
LSIEEMEMNALVGPAMFAGLGAVAVWVHLRYPRLRPGSIVRAVAHIAFSFLGFALVPMTLHLLLPTLPSQALQPYIVLALLIPTLTYVLLSWVWLIARILHDLFGGKPRGGLPVTSET